MLELSGQALTLEQIASVSDQKLRVVLSETARVRVQRSREVIEELLRQGRVVYGVNTGFGKLSDVHIPPSELELLQLNLVRSHACGIGKPLGEAETRAMMLLRANVLARGNSGCRVQVIETLLEMLERGVYPVIPEKGSVGASGDLAPLAHLALSMIGEGESWFGGERLPGEDALRRAEIAPVRLAAKEGLALLNGTQAMGAVGGLALYRAERADRTRGLGGSHDARGAAGYAGRIRCADSRSQAACGTARLGGSSPAVAREQRDSPVAPDKRSTCAGRL